MKVSELAEIVDAKFEGDANFAITSLAAKPEQAQYSELALVFANRFAKAIKLIKNSKARAHLISNELNLDEEFISYKNSRVDENLIYIICARPKFALSKIIKHFHEPRYSPNPGIDKSACVDASAVIDSSASIGAMVFVGPEARIAARTKIYPRVYIGSGVSIGKDCEIHAGVVIEDYCVLGDRVIIQPNAVIGADGYSYITEEPTNLEKMQKRDFNFAMDRQMQHKIISAGNVIIDDDVEIGANTCIDRGTIGPTQVGYGTKIDNLCQIAHNVQIGKDCLIIAQTGIAGSAKIGDRVTMAGASGCGDGVEIGNDVVVGAFSAVNSNVDPFIPVLGAPAIPYNEFMRRQRAIAKLPKQQEEFRKLKARVEELGK
jgi:UDP-3-O-[3-hydroxymyristoyl] glucosamine N-acyltransferase